MAGADAALACWTDKYYWHFWGRSPSSAHSLNGIPIPPRHFDRLSAALDEVIEARIWDGIHFRTADVQGTVIGKKVAKYVRKHYVKPLHCI
jgi:hypothetical protein